MDKGGLRSALLRLVVLCTALMGATLDRAAARHMIRQGAGVILAFGGYGDPLPGYHLGGLQVAFGAIESLRRNLACELGPHGIRVVTLQTGGVPESIPEGVDGREAITAEIARRTMVGRAATLEDVGNVAAFAASDMARSITATQINITCGSIVDWFRPVRRRFGSGGSGFVLTIAITGAEPIRRRDTG